MSIFTKVKIGSIEVFTNPRLALGVFTNVQARMNSILMTFFLTIFVKHFISDSDEAYSLAMMYSGIAQSLGMVSAVLFGFVFEKAKHSNLLLLNNICILIGYTMLLFIDGNNKLCILAFCFGAFGFYGLATIGYVIVNKNVNFATRGAVMGINTWAGAIGIVLLTKVGGILFETLSVRSPFIMCAIMSLIVIISVLFPNVRDTLDHDNSDDNK